MKQPASAAVWLRLTAITAALLALVVGVTFALFQSNMTEIQGSTISSASAHLLLSGDNQHFSDTLPGFLFNQLQPGGPPAPANGYDVFLKNDGSAPLNLAVNMDDGLSNPQHLNLGKVYLIATPEDGDGRKLALSTLYNNYESGSYQPLTIQLNPGETVRVSLRVQMDAAAVTSTTTAATLQNVDFMFIGNAIDTNAVD